MPGVFNIGNNYNVNNKKISSKLTFNSGEKFSGKIIKSEGSNEVTIKLIDGWEFQAELEGDLDFLNKEFQRFQVEGFEDGKLKLKLLNSDIKSDKSIQSELFNEILLKEGLNKKDINLLKDMLKFSIPLTKENIKDIKGLVEFLDKLQKNPDEDISFISKYLESNKIDINSNEGIKIKNNLKDFFNELKTLSKEDILLFFENDIELNKENIVGYKNIFKSESGILKLLNDIYNSMDSIKGEAISEDSIIKESIKNNIDIKGLIEEQDIKSKDGNVNNKIANTIYEKNENSNNKISLKSILKAISGESEEYINTTLKEILVNRKSEFTNYEFNKAFNYINSLTSDDIIENIFINLDKINNKNLNNMDKLEFTKVDVERELSKVMGKEITLTKEEFNKFKDIINLKIKGNLNNKEVSKENVSLKDIESEKVSINKVINSLKNEELLSKDLIKSSINDTGKSSKDIIKELISSIKGEGKVSEKILDIINNNINEIKLFNKISNEYYYADIPINIQEKEYPCKIIVKDSRKDSKKIDSSNVKMIITIDTKNLGIVDGYMKVLDKKINVELKCEERYVKIINMAKSKLVNNIEALGFLVDIDVTKKEEEVSLATCRGFFNSDYGTAINRMV